MSDFLTSQPDGESAAPETRYEMTESRIRPDDKKLALAIKRLVDIIGSLTVLFIFSPFLVAIAAIVKLTSRGPVLFRQDRVGQHGKHFTFLKFRSMYVNCDPTIHQQYVKSLITQNAAAEPGKNGTAPVYKLTSDPRVTPAGRFIRRTSLDELPQLFNVLKGEMSLVGPRPAIPYEVAHYDMWHRQRLIVKPGITGLWQVSGRSRVKFDRMVALDLEYAESWSIWLDIKILVRTPGAVLFGDGAY